MSFIQAHWLGFTISYHTLSTADSVLLDNTDEEDQTRYQSNFSIDGIDDEYANGIRALIIGCLSMVNEITEKKRSPTGD